MSGNTRKPFLMGGLLLIYAELRDELLKDCGACDVGYAFFQGLGDSI